MRGERERVLHTAFCIDRAVYHLHVSNYSSGTGPGHYIGQASTQTGEGASLAKYLRHLRYTGTSLAVSHHPN